MKLIRLNYWMLAVGLALAVVAGNFAAAGFAISGILGWLRAESLMEEEVK